MKSSLLLWLSGILLCGCDDSTGPRVGTESHFFEACEKDSDCTSELACIAQRCTLTCSSDSSCEGLPGDVVCLANPDGSRGSSCALAESAAAAGTPVATGAAGHGGTAGSPGAAGRGGAAERAGAAGAAGRGGGAGAAGPPGGAGGAGAAAGAFTSASSGASARGGTASEGEVAAGTGPATADGGDAGEGVSGTAGVLGLAGMDASGAAGGGLAAGASAGGSAGTVGVAGVANVAGSAGHSNDPCQAPASYQFMATGQLGADLQGRVGQQVAFTSRVQTGTPACTDLLCDADPCCNSCIVPLATLSLSLGLTDGEVEGVGCSGTNCDYADHCEPTGLLGEHLLWGVIQEFYGSYQLMLDGYCP